MLSIHSPVHRPSATATAPVVDTRPTMLITEQEVKLLTAAAIAAPARPRLLSRWIAARRAARAARPSRQRHTVRHYEFLEYAAMARAMEKL